MPWDGTEDEKGGVGLERRREEEEGRGGGRAYG